MNVSQRLVFIPINHDGTCHGWKSSILNCDDRSPPHHSWSGCTDQSCDYSCSRAPCFRFNSRVLFCFDTSGIVGAEFLVARLASNWPAQIVAAYGACGFNHEIAARSNTGLSVQSNGDKLSPTNGFSVPCVSGSSRPLAHAPCSKSRNPPDPAVCWAERAQNFMVRVG